MLDFLQIVILLGVLFAPTLYLYSRPRASRILGIGVATLPVTCTLLGYYMARTMLAWFHCQYEHHHLECIIQGVDWSAWIGYGDILGTMALYAGIPMMCINGYLLYKQQKRRK